MMVFAIAAGSLAHSVSSGYLVNGKDKISLRNGEGKCDAKNIILGGNFDINDQLSLSGEFTDCDLEGGDFDGLTIDNSSYKLKGNYAILQNKQVRLDLSAGYLYRKASFQVENLNVKLEGKTLFLGPNIIFNLAENTTLAAGFEYGLTPDGEISAMGQSTDVDIDSVLNYQVDFNYYITKQIGLSLGYRSSR
jgi:hypothetical protein